MDGANPLDDAEIFDHIVIAGTTSPGVATVTGASRAYDWDVKKGKGSSGATVTFQGEPPAKFKVSLKLWRPEHFGAWDKLREILKTAQKGKKVEALDVVHPYLADLDVHAVVVETIGQLEHAGKGLFTVEISLLEYKPPKKVGGGTPKTYKAAAWVHANPEPAMSAQDKEILELLKKAMEP